MLIKRILGIFLLLTIIVVGVLWAGAKDLTEFPLINEIVFVTWHEEERGQGAPLTADPADRDMPGQKDAADGTAHGVVQEEGRLSTAEFSPAEAEMLNREFAWNYGGKQWTYRLQVPRGTYNHYAGRERLPLLDYNVLAIYVTDPGHKEIISSLAEAFSDTAAKEGYSLKQTVEFVLSFVQSIEYRTDEESKGLEQYTRYPLETLVDLEGDCKDKSILYASILKEMGLGVVLVILPGEPGHMAVGVKGEDLPGTYYEYQGARYYYVETTAWGWQIGQIPPDYRNREAIIVPIRPQPLLLHKWESRSAPNGQLELVVTVDNLGSAVARQTKVYTFLDVGNDKAYAQQWSEPLDLKPGSRGIYTHYLRVPAGVETRIVVKIISDGYLIDKSHSDWFST
ncbi:MAG: hypothetical protein AB1420_07760 [Bacillota bacterium]